MSLEISIPISTAALAALDRLDPARALAGVAKAMDLENHLTLRHITLTRVTGEKGPFDPSLHKLGQRTSLLKKSLRASAATTSGNTITSAIGTNVKYAGLHEFGGVIKHPPRAGKVRLRTDAGGNLLRRGVNGRLATFAKNSHKRAVERSFTTRGHEVIFPARAPIRHGIEDRRAAYGAAISAAITSALTGGAA